MIWVISGIIVVAVLIIITTPKHPKD